MKSSATSLLIVFCVLFSSVPNMGQSCMCSPTRPGGNTTCERGQIAVCGVDGDGACAGRCVGAISTAASERQPRVEEIFRRLDEKSGVTPNGAVSPGSGGPDEPLDADRLAALDDQMSQSERKVKAYENAFRDRGFSPTVWPVVGKLESGFGGRRNPFGGRGYEFHSGQDIDAPSGAPVIAGANGKVTFVGWQNGYGQLVVIALYHHSRANLPRVGDQP